MRNIKIFNKFTNLFIFILLLLNIFLFPINIFATDEINLTHKEKEWLAEHPTIRFGYSADHEPSLIVADDGSLSGILKDVLDLLNQHLGTDFDILVYNFSDGLNKATNKEIDGFLTIKKGGGSHRKLLETNTIITGFPVVYARADTVFELRSLDDLKGRTVALLNEAWYAEKVLEPYQNQIDIVETEATLQGLRLLYEGKVDFMVGTSLDMYQINSNMLTGLEPVLVVTEEIFEGVIGVRNDWPELVEILNKGLESINKDELYAIYAKWRSLPQPTHLKFELTLEEQAWLAANQTINVTFSQESPYFSSIDGEVAGIGVDFLNTISKYTGITFIFTSEPYEFSDTLKGVIDRSGSDILPAVMPSPDQENVILFTQPYIRSPRFIFTRDDAPFISSIDDLLGKKVSVIEDYVTHKYLAANYPDIDLVVVGTKKEAIEAVSSGKAFAYIGDILSTPASINQFGFKNLKAACPSGLSEHSLAIGIRNDWPELRDILDKALVAIPADEKAAIINKWSTVRIEYGIEPADIIKWTMLVLFIVSAILFTLGFWNRSLKTKVAERTADFIESESRFRGIFEQAAVGIANVSLDGNFLRLNHKFCSIVDYPMEELLEKTFQEITYPDDLDKDLDLVQQLIDGKADTYTLEKRYLRRNSSIVWVNITVKIIRDDDNQPKWFVSVIEDISERKAYQRQITDSYERFRAYMDQSTEGIWCVAFDEPIDLSLPEEEQFELVLKHAYVAEANNAYAKHVGLENWQELIGTRVKDFLTPSNQTNKSTIMNWIRARYTIRDAETIESHKNGITRNILNNATAMVKAGCVERVWGTQTDITEKKQVEEKLRYQAALLENVSDAVLSVDNNFKIVSWNEAAEKIYGWKAEEALGRRLGDFLMTEYPNDSREEIMGKLERDGLWQGEVAQKRKDGKPLSIQSTISHLKDDAGVIIGFVGVNRDNTELRYSELKVSEHRELLTQMERRESLGQLAGSIAHELNQPLTGILSDAQAGELLLKKEAVDKGQIAEIFTDIVSDTKRASQIIQQLRGLFGNKTLNSVYFNLNSLVMDTLQLLNSEFIQQGVSINTDLSITPLNLYANKIQLQQVLINLFTNSLQAMQQSGKVDRQISINTTLDGDDQVVLCMTDNGPGIDPVQLETIFDPLVTTKEDGTGMGLAISKSIVLSHGGRIWAANSSLGGVSICFALPKRRLDHDR